MRLVEIRLMDWGGVDGGKEVVGRGQRTQPSPTSPNPPPSTPITPTPPTRFLDHHRSGSVTTSQPTSHLHVARPPLTPPTLPKNPTTRWKRKSFVTAGKTWLVVSCVWWGWVGEGGTVGHTPINPPLLPTSPLQHPFPKPLP